MKITIIKTGEERSSKAQSLSDVQVSIRGVPSLDTLCNKESTFTLFLEDETLNTKVIEDITWKDVIPDVNPDYKIEGMGVKNIKMNVKPSADSNNYCTTVHENPLTI